MLSPKKITQLGLTLGGLSIAGIPFMMFAQPNFGFMNWWPAYGLILAVLCFVTAIAYGAYLTAQKRADMVDMLNDCYTGVEPQKER